MDYQNLNINNEYQNISNIQNFLSENQNDSLIQMKNYIFVLEQNLKNQIMENSSLKNEIISLNNELKKKNIIIKDLLNLESKYNDLNEEINNLKTEKSIIKDQLNSSSIELENKEKIIQELKYKLNNNENLIINNKINELLIERDELINQNNELKNGFEKYNEGIKEANYLFNIKTESLNQIIIDYSNKIKIYRNKIQQLKLKINELYYENLELKNKIENFNFYNDEITKRSIFENNSKNKFENINLENNFEKLDNIEKSDLNKNNINNQNIESSIDKKKNINKNSFINNESKENTPIKNSKNSYFKNKNINNIIITESIPEIEDPYSEGQQKSIDEFKKILLKVDENLFKNKEFISYNKDE